MPATFSSIDIGQFETENLSSSNKKPSTNNTNQSGGILGELARKQQTEKEVWERLWGEKAATPAPQPEYQVQIKEIKVERIEIGGSKGLAFKERAHNESRESIQLNETHGSLSFKTATETKSTGTEHKGLEFKVPAPAQKMGEKAMEVGTKAGKKAYVETKEFCVALFHLVKDQIFFSLKKDKDPKKAKEAAERKAKQVATIKAFFSQLKEALFIFKNKKLEEEVSEEKQLGIAGMSEEERNELLGKNRNKKNKNISGAYFRQATAGELIARKNLQQKAQKEQSVAETSKPVVNMHGAIEGGTGGGKVNVSTTGGAGVG